jgi:hypothetical protein
MRRLFILLVVAVGLLGAVGMVFQLGRGQADSGSGNDKIINSESDGQNTRAVYAPVGLESVNQPNIGFIDSPTATCYQPDPAQDVCRINWYYLNVSAAPNYIISMTVSLAPYGYLANAQGFFQQSMYIPYNMLGDGFKVPCGGANPSYPGFGNAYNYTIRAKDSAGLGSANYGTVVCPLYRP